MIHKLIIISEEGLGISETLDDIQFCVDNKAILHIAFDRYCEIFGSFPKGEFAILTYNKQMRMNINLKDLKEFLNHASR